MAESDRLKWNGKYGEPGYRMGEGPKRVLRDAAPWLPTSGVALDVASGEGQTAVWLAERGLEVDAVEISSVGIEKSRRLASAAGVSDRIRFFEHDLDDGLPDVREEFDVVTSIHFHSAPLMPALLARLRPGGLLVMEVLGPGNAERAIPARFLASSDAVLAYAESLEIVEQGESNDGVRDLVRLVARKAL